ncbi:unnamed protein product [Oikopleura dioica]|uniref:Uncharacterized protein n=1 Tax=Oikopleura dioica TaxID=34765 RepID=E4XYK6_OIKDI|nr:unnamed protein product [Oikopleura dioica]
MVAIGILVAFFGSVICEKVEHYNFPKGVFPWSDYRNGKVLLSDLGIAQENYEIFKPPVEIKVKAIGDESGKSGVFMRQELPNHFDELIASIDDDDEDELTIIQFDEEVEEGTKVVVTLNFIDGKEDDEKESEFDLYNIEEMDTSSESPFDSSQTHLSFTIRPTRGSREPIAIRLSELQNDPRNFFFLKTEINEEESNDDQILLRSHFKLEPEYLLDSVSKFFDFKKLLLPFHQILIEDEECFEKKNIEVDENGNIIIDYLFFQKKESCVNSAKLNLHLASHDFEIFLPKNSHAPKLIGISEELKIVMEEENGILSQSGYLLVEDKDGLTSGIGLPVIMGDPVNIYNSIEFLAPIRTPHENILLYEYRAAYNKLSEEKLLSSSRFIKISDQPIYDALKKSSIYEYSFQRCKTKKHKFITSASFEHCEDPKLAMKILAAQLNPCETELHFETTTNTVTITSTFEIDSADSRIIRTKEILKCREKNPRKITEEAKADFSLKILPYLIPVFAFIFILVILGRDLTKKGDDKDSLERIFFLLESLFILLDISSTAAVLSIYLEKQILSGFSVLFIILMTILMISSTLLLIFRNLMPMDHVGWIILDSLTIKSFQILLIGLYFVPFIPASFGYPIYLIVFAVFGLLGFLWNMVMWFSKLTEEREKTKEMIFFAISGGFGLVSWICFVVYIMMTFGRQNFDAQFRCVDIKEEYAPSPFSCFDIGQFFYIIPATGAVLFGIANLIVSLKSTSDPGPKRLLDSSAESRPSNRENHTLLTH